MELDPLSRYLPSVGLGAIAGIRSLAAPAIAADWLEAHDPGPRAAEIAQALASETVGDVLKGLAVVEMIGEKLPFLPDRTEAPALVVRAMAGAVAGSALAAAKDARPAVGAVLGAVAAIGVTWASRRLRRRLMWEYGVPELVMSLLEDGFTTAVVAAVNR